MAIKSSSKIPMVHTLHRYVHQGTPAATAFGAAAPAGGPLFAGCCFVAAAFEAAVGAVGVELREVATCWALLQTWMVWPTLLQASQAMSTKAQSFFTCPSSPQHLHASVVLGGVVLERHIFARCPGLLHVWHIDPSVRL